MTISTLLKNNKAFLFDLDGTLYLGGSVIDGAKETLALLRAQGKKVVYLSNNSSRTKKEYEQKLKTLGLWGEGDIIYTSVDASILYLKTHFENKKIFLVATKAVQEEFICAGIHLCEDDPDVALLAYDTELTFEKIKKLDSLLRRGVVFLATHADDVCPTETGSMPDVGSFLKLFERSAGRLPDRILGKPYEDMAKGVMDVLKLDHREICMVGDRLYTDIRFANKNKFDSVLVLSGESNLLSLSKFPDKPTLVLPSVKDLQKGV